MRKKFDYRYQVLNRNGKILATGNRLIDVSVTEWNGPSLIIDYHLIRFAFRGPYPPSRDNWHPCKSYAILLNHPEIKKFFKR